MINVLVDNGAHLDFRMGARFDFQSVLHLSATQGKLKSLRKLIDLNAWVDAPNASNLTALYSAALGGHTEACLRLLIAGANPNIADESGRTPLHIVNFSLDKLRR
jgi:ankyrin repeat protein